MAFNWKTKMAKPSDEADMSMEEILTSIRRYVTNEQPPFTGSRDRHLSETRPMKNPVVPDKNGDVIELTEPLENSPQKNSPPIKETSSAVNSSPVQVSSPSLQEHPTYHQPSSSQSAPAHPAMTEPSAYHPPHLKETVSESLASQHTVSASTQSFSRLVGVAQQQTARAEVMTSVTLDQLIIDATKPLIKEWIDRNLASLVEVMVAKEIERITRGGKF